MIQEIVQIEEIGILQNDHFVFDHVHFHVNQLKTLVLNINIEKSPSRSGKTFLKQQTYSRSPRHSCCTKKFHRSFSRSNSRNQQYFRKYNPFYRPPSRPRSRSVSASRRSVKNV